MNSFYITGTLGGSTKKTLNLNLSFEKADSTPSPPPKKRESTLKKNGVSAPNPLKLNF